MNKNTTTSEKGTYERGKDDADQNNITTLIIKNVHPYPVLPLSYTSTPIASPTTFLPLSYF
ncbi:hypothetical protein PIROE2DRAFT_10014 [Piromyces sp. E2]|nr:hypothetical protein PIROE2DRAFT_10014 [Piromyces sp. E2]|eukprot:OUM63465.1 hypothetical protein PIROE2DRAFT_10014 [Piromyces sp. E2]